MQRSKLLLGSLVTVGVLGFGAAAVALDGSTGDTGSLEGTTTTTVADSSSSTTTSTTIAPTTTLAPAPTTAVAGAPGDATGTADGGGVARSTDGCDGGTYANHGAYVSSVAHDAGRAPGDVAAAAQSDCGKPVTGATGDAPESSEPPDTEAPETEAPETEAPDGERPASPGNSANAGNGNGNGNGNGRSHP